MANYSQLKAAIADVIKTNGTQAITGQVLQDVLNSIVSVIGANYTFAGVATPITNPGTPDQNVVYMASEAGTYTNFGAVVLPAGIHLLMWNGSWSTQTFFTVDNEPTAGSNNLVKSGGVYEVKLQTQQNKADISESIPLNTSTVIENSYFNSIGGITSSANFDIYKYPVESGKLYTFSGDMRPSGIRYIAWADSNDNVIKVEGYNGADGAYIDKVVEAPSGAAYAWLNVKKTNSSSYNLKLVLDTLKSDDLQSQINNYGVPITWEQGRLSATGANVKSTYSIRSKNYIDVSETDDFYLDIPYNGYINVYFYNGETFLSRLELIKSNIVVPSGANKMRINFQYSSTINIGPEEAKNVHLYRLTTDIGGLIKSIVSLVPIEDWQPDTHYIVGRQVRSSASVYGTTVFVCKEEHTSTSEFDSSKFSEQVLCKRTDTVLKSRIEVKYMLSGPSSSLSVGDIWYNTSINCLILNYRNPDSEQGITRYQEVIPWCNHVEYIFDGIKYVWDEEICNLVVVDDLYENVTSNEISQSGMALGLDGSPVVSQYYNLSPIIELDINDVLILYSYESQNGVAISETDLEGSFYTPLLTGHGSDGINYYRYISTKHQYVIATLYYTGASYRIIRKKSIQVQIVPEFDMVGFFTQYGTIQYSSGTPYYKISNPIKLYSGDRIKIHCYTVSGRAVMLKYQDRWNTYWANNLGNSNILIQAADSNGWHDYDCVVKKTGYYVFSCNVRNDGVSDTIPEISVIRSPWQIDYIDKFIQAEKDSYAIEKHNYVDEYDFVPDLVAKRSNAILTYSADNKKSSNFIVNAVAYPNGEIIACRAGGDVVKIANDGTETVLLNIPNAQDWRGMFMDSRLNVYVSPHSSTFSPGVSALDRGLYKLTYGASSFVKVISLCRSTTEITEWVADKTYAVGDKVMRDNQSDMYICKTAHTSESSFDVTYWNPIDAWTQETSYTVADLCKYGDRYYRCIENHTSGTSFDVSKWNAATEYMSNDDTIWTLCEDEKGYIYAGVYSHSMRANPAVYRSNAAFASSFFYQHNFIMNGTLPESTYGFKAVRHVHCINFNNYDNCLYAAVGEVNTICKSSTHGSTWEDMKVACYYGQPTYVLGVKDGLVIGSDGHYSCGVSKLMSDGETMKLCGRTAPGFIFNIRRSDLTGWLYAWTRIDNIVANVSQCPPPDAVDDIDVYNQWVANAPASTLRFWNPYHEWALKYYPEDARRPQNAVIMVSKDEGETWEVINKVKVSQNNASICGYITVGYFRDGECLAGLLKPIDNTEAGKSFVQPVVISEGKKKMTQNGYDLEGEIFIKTNNSDIVDY